MLEMMFAVTLFGGMIVALTNIWVAHAKSLEKSEARLVAINFAETVMEECIAEGFQARDRTQTILLEKSTYEVGRGTPIIQQVPYDVTVAVYDQTPANGAPTYKIVRVVVEYDESGGRSKAELESYVGWQG